MRIALINENSQAAKNAMIEAALKKVVTPMGHEVVNYGMYGVAGEPSLTYVQNGILAAILLNSSSIRPTDTCSPRSTTETPSPCRLPRALAGARS